MAQAPFRSITPHGIALCRCGVDMVDHGDDDFPVTDIDHAFEAAGTKYRCERWLPDSRTFCPRPRFHTDEGVPCGPLTGEKLW